MTIFNPISVHALITEHSGVLYYGPLKRRVNCINLLNELRKSDKMRGLPSILLLFHNKFNKFNNTRA